MTIYPNSHLVPLRPLFALLSLAILIDLESVLRRIYLLLRDSKLASAHPSASSSVTTLSSTGVRTTPGALTAPSTSISKSKSSIIRLPSATPTAGMAGSLHGPALALCPNSFYLRLQTSFPPLPYLQPSSEVCSGCSAGLAPKQTLHVQNVGSML